MSGIHMPGRWPYGALVLGVALVAGGLWSCGGGAPPTQLSCEFTYECPQGMICHGGACTATSDLIDGGARDGGGGETDAGSGGSDAGGAPDSGTTPPDAGSSTDGGPARATFGSGDYRRCHDDLECAVFGGNCLVELTLSRPDVGGQDRVKLSDLDSTFAVGEGICTLACTNDPRICESITLEGQGGQSVPFTCQLAYAGQSPYPNPAPAFPFDSQLDATALSRGVPYASVCRPPFQFAASRSASFCQPCTSGAQCVDGDGCFLDRAHTSPASGACVEACAQQSDCPFGFTCAAMSAGGPTYCLPRAGTCGRCLDADGDQRGVGRCGPLAEPNTAVDCDDGNPVAYYDSAQPGHAFPAVCGNSDVNCNGRSDEAEQLGSESHCSACGDVCIGRVGEIPNSRRACVQRQGVYECVADCDTGYADCDGDVSNGCEQALGANQIYAADNDGDLHGSLTEFRYVCNNQIPTGWVQNRSDCNDSNPTIFGAQGSLPGAPELCDGLDNNCNGLVDDPGRIVGENTACNTGQPGVCAAGHNVCNADGGTAGGFTCVPDRDRAQQSQVPESCDGLDNNCSGQTDEDVDYFRDQGTTNPRGEGTPAVCNVPNGVGICAQGVFNCLPSTSALPDGGTLTTAAWSCIPNPPDPDDLIDGQGIDSNCDGSDGNLSAAVFVRPVAGGGSLDGQDTNDGTAQRPVATLQRALALACGAGAPCRDIYVEAKSFPSNQPIEVPTFAVSSATALVRIYGGFAPTVECDTAACRLQWRRGTQRTTLSREAPPRGSDPAWPYGRSYAAITSATSGSGGLSLLLDQVDVETRSPDASAFLQNGESAPLQAGIQCPQRGCALLSVRNVSIIVEGAINGGDGAGAAVAPLGDVNGRNGCSPNDNCTGVGFVGGQWMEYPGSNVYSTWSNDNLPGRAVAGCPDGQRNNGGTSGAIRWQGAGGGNRSYDFDGWSGGGFGGGNGGTCWSSRDTGANPHPTWRHPGHGSDGSGGSGSSRFGTARFTFLSSGGALQYDWGMGRTNAGHGSSGKGGGGGAGCIDHPNYFACPCGHERGGGGGAGGCGGFRAGNGGHGGHAVGLLFVPPASPDVGRMSIDEEGSFSVSVGKGGKGGNGGKGGDGVGGGYGGLAPSRNAYNNGGHGGDGGGGGGGSGGFGGVSLGVVRHCNRAGGSEANGCGMQVPPRLLAAPGQYISVGAGGVKGAGGVGGAAGKKPPDVSRSDSSSATGGNPGAEGIDGFSASLQFTY